MAKFCLIPKLEKAMRTAIEDGSLDIDKLNSIKDSKSRRDYIAKFVGENTAIEVNTLFEKKLLLVNQDRAISSFIDELTGVSKEKKKTLKEKVKSSRDKRLAELKEAGYDLNEVTSDIYSTKYNTDISLEQAQVITELFADMDKYKSKMKEDGTWDSEKDKLLAGAYEHELNKYTGTLKQGIEKETLVNPFTEKGFDNKAEAVLKDVRMSISFTAKAARSLVSGVFDNSFWGNQGSKAALNPLYTKSWAKNFAKSFKDAFDIATQGTSKGDEIMDAVWTYYYSNPNRINGRYQGKVEDGKKGNSLSLGNEEDIPVELSDIIRNAKIGKKQVSDIPVLREAFELAARPVKMAEVIYEAGAMRLRMDVADNMYRWAEKTNGVDLTSNKDIGGINTIVNSMTGRGSLGELERAGKVTNSLFFSTKLIKGDIDFLTSHIADENISIKLKEKAATNLVSTIAFAALILGLADALGADVEWDDTKSTFGSINGVNIAGSGRAFWVLGARIAKWESTNANTDITASLGNQYGQKNGLDLAEDFLENKTAPLMSVIKDNLKGQTFEGEKPTVNNELKNITTPMGIESTMEIMNGDGSALEKLINFGASFSGFNVSNIQSNTNWDNSTSKELTKFKEKVGEDKFKEANEVFNDRYNEYLKTLKEDEKYNAMTDEKKLEFVTKKKDKLKESVLREYRG